MNIDKSSDNVFYKLAVSMIMTMYLNFEYFAEVFMYTGYGLIAYCGGLSIIFFFNLPKYLYTVCNIFFLILFILVFLMYFVEIYNFLFNRYEYKENLIKKQILVNFRDKISKKSIKAIIFQAILIHIAIIIIVIAMIIYGIYMLFWSIAIINAISIALYSLSK